MRVFYPFFFAESGQRRAASYGWYWVLALLLQSWPGQARPPLRGVPPQQLVAGQFHSLLLRADGTLYAWGENAVGQLGDGTLTQRRTPVALGAAGNRFGQVASGSSHSLALTVNGTVYAWGFNSSGQLGDNSTASHSVPVAVALGAAPAGTRFTQVSAGYAYSLALTADGMFYAWGANGYGQLGDNSTTDRHTPVPVALGAVPSGTRFVQVAAGVNHSLALAADGTLYAWGSNDYGQLGDNTTTDRYTPVAVGPGATPAGTRFIQIATGSFHSLALAADGTLYAWGNNAIGQLGDGTTTSHSAPVAVAQGAAPASTRFVQVSGGSNHSLALAADGTPYAWGYNGYGQLGDNSTINRPFPAAVALGAAPAGTRFTQVAAGTFHSLALAADGTPYAFGSNSNGQLGDNSTIQRLIPVAVAAGTGNGYTQASAGGYHALGLRADGMLYAWGYNGDGQLGDGTATAQRPNPMAVAQGAVPAGTRFTQVSASVFHSLALAADGSLYSWGSNDYGQLGDGTTTARRTPVAVLPGAAPAGTRFIQVAAGQFHSLALAADGTLYAWGSNGVSQLGDGFTTDRFTPGAVLLGAAPAGTRFAQVCASGDNSLALAADGTLFAWGNNLNGQLGDGTTTTRRVPTAVLLGAAPAGTRFVQIATGQSHSLALAANGMPYAWGTNSYGQLGDGTTTNRLSPVAVALGAAPAGTRFTQVVAGKRHSLALASGALYAWGINDRGQLGDNSTTQRNVAVRENSAGTGWAAVASCFTADFSLALGDNGIIFSAGYNAFGQLGDGTTTNSPVFVRSRAPLPVRAEAMAVVPFTVYPNPASGAATVSGLPAGTLFTVLDALGREVAHAAADAAGAAHFVLPAGLYVVRGGGAAQRVVIE